MFLAALFIAVGLAILLGTLGILNGTFWGLFWAIFFIAIGLKMMRKQGKCPMCGWGNWQGRMHGKIHEKMTGHCCDDEECCDECEDCEDEKEKK
jgi:hypothetical protein